MRRLLLVALAALALAAPAQAKPVLGITGDAPRFQAVTGQQSVVRQAFLGWGQGLSYGSPFVALFGTLTPVPMIHLNTGKGSSAVEAITPAQIAAGAGDAYLIALNQAIAQWGKGVYVRPMAEMNNYGNLWSGFTKSGAAKAGHSPADYRKAFARIYLLLHGGSAASVSAKLKALGLPGIASDLASNPFPRLRIVWAPLAGGNPRIAANDAQNYYPGNAYVDVVAGDIFEEGLGDTAPWRDLEKLYANRHGKPFAVPEWGLFGVDDDVFVKHMCTFLRTHPATEEASLYNSKSGSIFDLGSKPKSKAVYRSCITPLGAPVPAWAAQSSGGGVTSTTPTATFTLAGVAIPGSAVSAPIGADEIDVNINPNTGVIASAYWVRAHKSLGPMKVAAGATGLVFQTKPGAAPAALTYPQNATDFHVTWSASNVFTGAWWTRVGKVLAQIQLSAGQTSIAVSKP